MKFLMEQITKEIVDSMDLITVVALETVVAEMEATIVGG